MRVAAWQAPYLPFGSMDAVGLLRAQLSRCEAEGVAVLCCPEAVIFVPTHSGHLTEPSASFRARGDNLPVARAVENAVTVVVADVAGRQGDRFAYGFSAVIDPDGQVLAKATSGTEELLIVDIEPRRRDAKDPRGWDGHTNPAVTRAFLRLWQPEC